MPLPWTGAAIGSDDVSYVAARSAPRLLGIIGPQNAGKTTLLGAWYLLLNRGNRLPGRIFAGSCSFGGWENLAGWLRWLPDAGPRFPPHTSLHDQRQPGLLHLALRRENGVLEDLLLTDAPGEWFNRWVINSDDLAAEGARWTIQKADAIAIVIDCQALAGPDRGIVRNQVYNLVQRLGDERTDRMTVIIWAKSDHKVDVEMQAAIEGRIRQRLPESPHFRVSIKGADTPAGTQALLAPLFALLAYEPALPRPLTPLPVPVGSDAFLSYRGK